MKDLREQLKLPILAGTRVVLMQTIGGLKHEERMGILVTGKLPHYVEEVLASFRLMPDTAYCKFGIITHETRETRYGYRHYFQSMGVLA